MKYTGIWLALLLVNLQAAAQQEDWKQQIQTAFFNANHPQAQVLSKEAIKAHPDSAVFYYYRGRALQELRNYPEARKSVQKALALDSTRRSYHMMLGRLHVAQNQHARAEKIFRRLFVADTTDIHAGISLTRTLLKRKAYNEALKVYRTLQAAQPDNPYFTRYIGYCLFKLDQPQQALPYFQEALAEDSTDLTAYLYAARIYAAADSNAMAMQTVNAALEVFPRNADLYELKGRLHRKNRQYARVAEAYQNAWRLGAHTPSNAKNLGSSYFQLGQYARSIGFLRKLKGKERTALVTWTLGQAYLQLQQPDSALYFLRRAHYAMKPDFRIYRNLMRDMAKTYLKKRSYEKAIAVYREIAENEYVIPDAYRPNYKAEASVSIGDIYDRHLNAPAKALKWYQKAADLQTHLPPRQSEYVRKKVTRLKEEAFMEQ